MPQLLIIPILIAAVLALSTGQPGTMNNTACQITLSPGSLSLHLSANGIDLLPQGASSVIIDDFPLQEGDPVMRLNEEGEGIHVIRAAASRVSAVTDFSRMVVLVEGPRDSAYLLDRFDVAGGARHRYTLAAPPGVMQVEGLDAKPTAPVSGDLPLRNCQQALRPAPGWVADWAVDEQHLRCTGLTPYADVYTAECRTDDGTHWAPWTMVQRRASEGNLHSTFLTVMEPHTGEHAIAATRLLPVETLNGRVLPESFAAVEVAFRGLRTDLILSTNGGGGTEMVEPFHAIHFTGLFAWIRLHGRLPERMFLLRPAFLRVGDLTIAFDGQPECVELTFDGSTLSVVQGLVASVHNGADAVSIVDAHSQENGQPKEPDP